MKLSQKFTLRTMGPQPGGTAAIWISIKPKEVFDAEAVGSGPGVPDDNGTPTPGTIVPGTIVEVDENGLAIAHSSWTFTAGAGGMPKLPFVAWTGNDDFSGSFVGDVICFNGGCRFDTEQFDAATYTPGQALVANAGKWAGKAAAGDGVASYAIVGPRGKSNVTAFGNSTGILDVIMVQGLLGN
jgi:hypothetical protein